MNLFKNCVVNIRGKRISVQSKLVNELIEIAREERLSLEPETLKRAKSSMNLSDMIDLANHIQDREGGRYDQSHYVKYAWERS